MRVKIKSLLILIITQISLSTFIFSQNNNFINISDTFCIISDFQEKIIEDKGLKAEFATNFPNAHKNPVIVYLNLKENNEDIGSGDPYCLWVNKSIIDTIESIRWVEIKELYLKKKYVYYTLEIFEKKENKMRIVTLYKYKIREDRVCKGPRNFYRKIKVKRYSNK